MIQAERYKLTGQRTRQPVTDFLNIKDNQVLNKYFPGLSTAVNDALGSLLKGEQIKPLDFLSTALTNVTEKVESSVEGLTSGLSKLIDENKDKLVDGFNNLSKTDKGDILNNVKPLVSKDNKNSGLVSLLNTVTNSGLKVSNKEDQINAIGGLLNTVFDNGIFNMFKPVTDFIEDSEVLKGVIKTTLHDRINKGDAKGFNEIVKNTDKTTLQSSGVKVTTIPRAIQYTKEDEDRANTAFELITSLNKINPNWFLNGSQYSLTKTSTGFVETIKPNTAIKPNVNTISPLNDSQKVLLLNNSQSSIKRSFPSSLRGVVYGR